MFLSAMACRNDQQWMERALEIPQTCLNYYRYDFSAARYLSRCSCPFDMVEHSGNCISPNQCPCTYNNVLYNAGQIINVDCNKW
jgi:hypothetical protein